MQIRLTPQILFAAMLMGLTVYACSGGLPLEHRATSPAPTIVVSATPAGIAAAIAGANAALPPPFGSFRLHRSGDSLFPEESQLRMWAAKNADLNTYLAEPAQSRAEDLYLAAPDDLYWPSEYFRGSEQVAFRSNFLIHLAPQPTGTAMSIYEFLPQVRLGQRFGMTSHGPGFYYDDRWVAPTNKDKSDLLQAIKAMF